MPARHRIGQHTIDIEISDAGEAVAVQNQLSDLCRKRLYPALEQLFDRFADGETWLRIDRLELDLGELTANDWPQQFVEKTVLELERTLSQLRITASGGPTKRAVVAASVADQECFLFFLETGSLPWNSPVQKPAELEIRLEPSPELLRQVIELAQRKPLTLLRLVWQFSDAFLTRLAALLPENRDDDVLLDVVWKTVAPQLPDSPARRQTFLHYLRLASATSSSANGIVLDWLNPGIEAFFPAPQRVAIQQALREISEPAAHPKQKITETIDRPRTRPSTDEPTVFYINNAGLVLLHPYLPSLFRGLGLLAENGWIDQVAQNRGVFLCQYAVTGQQIFPESDLILAKILCGMPPEWPAESELVLTPNEQSEVRKLLQAVVSHWEALKTTSVEAMQESFLRRDGKLSRRDDGWRLQVEPQTIDILLDRLPWGFSLIKTSLMPEYLQVEWR